MKTTREAETEKEYLNQLCEEIRSLICDYHIEESREIVCDAMKEYPDAAEPHNLFGILMEKRGNHITAMKHFRAAWALDPTFLPARKNMENYGSFARPSEAAYTMEDCRREETKERFKIEYDENGVGHVVKRKHNDKQGIFCF